MEAVLIRGVEGISGPGRITKALGIGSSEKNLSANRENGLWISPGKPFSEEQVIRTPRIGVAYAEGWKDKPFRWVLVNNSRL